MLTAGKEVLTRNPVSETAATENRSQSRIQQAVLRLCSHRLPQAVHTKALRQDRVTKEASVDVYCVFSHSTGKTTEMPLTSTKPWKDAFVGIMLQEGLPMP